MNQTKAAAGSARGAREPLPDPAVADDAELAAGEGEVRQPVDGRPFPFSATGDLTVRRMMQRVAWTGEATLEGATLRGTASTTVKMSAFGFQPPELVGQLRVEDDVDRTCRVAFRRRYSTAGGWMTSPPALEHWPISTASPTGSSNA